MRLSLFMMILGAPLTLLYPSILRLPKLDQQTAGSYYGHGHPTQAGCTCSAHAREGYVVSSFVRNCLEGSFGCKFLEDPNVSWSRHVGPLFRNCSKFSEGTRQDFRLGSGPGATTRNAEFFMFESTELGPVQAFCIPTIPYQF